jgi:hypothetical protein
VTRRAVSRPNESRIRSTRMAPTEHSAWSMATDSSLLVHLRFTRLPIEKSRSIWLTVGARPNAR